MRPIEFRAWDKTNKEFVTDFVLDYLGNEYQTNKCEFWGDDRNIILMQFTGLKDKNGVKIFEMDIIGDSAVVYNYDAFGLINLHAYTKHNNYDENNFYLHKRLSNISFDELIVIGNIYQNPDLLKEI